MSDRRLIDWDPETREALWHHWDDATGTAMLETVHDVEPILEANRAVRIEDERLRPGRMGDMFRVASIPNGVAHKWLIEKGLNIHDRNHWPAVKKLLNDPEWRYLRTSASVI